MRGSKEKEQENKRRFIYATESCKDEEEFSELCDQELFSTRASVKEAFRSELEIATKDAAEIAERIANGADPKRVKQVEVFSVFQPRV